MVSDSGSPQVRAIQNGVHCDHCGDDIYSNRRDDFTECRCGMWNVNRGFDPVVDGPGLQVSEIKWISREVDRDTLPARYRERGVGVVA